MVRDLPYFIQFTMVAGESVDTQVRVRFPAWWVRDVIRGGSAEQSVKLVSNELHVVNSLLNPDE